MSSFFNRRDPWGHGLALWVLAGLLFALPLGWTALKTITLDNDVEKWLPADDHQARIYAWYQEHFPVQHSVLISWDGSTLDDPRLDDFVARMEGRVDPDGVRRGGIEEVASVLTAETAARRMIEYGIDPDVATSRLEGVLLGKGRLKVRLTDAGRRRQDQTLRSLDRMVQDRLGIALTHLPAVSAWQADAYEQIGAEEFDEWDDSENWDDDRWDDNRWDDEQADESDAVVITIPPHDVQLVAPGLLPGTALAEQVITLAKSHRGLETAAEPDGELLVEDCFFAVGSPIAVVATLSEAGKADRPTAIGHIKQAAAAAGIALENLHLGGSPVAGAELNQGVLRAAWNPAAPLWRFDQRSVILLSGAVGIILAFVFLKSIRLGLLVVMSSYYATFLAMTLVPVTGGSMNMVLIVMPTLLTVLTLSGAIHVANYWKHAAHENPATAIATATRMAMQPCALASLTTAIGLISLLSSSLTPVREFGVYSAVGCLIALVMVLYGLPSLLQIWRSPPPSAQEIDATRWRAFGGWLARYSTPVTVACLTIAAVSTYGLKWFQTETKVIRYFADDSTLVQDYRFLEENLSGITPIDTIIRFNKQSQQDLAFVERMEIVREIEKAIGEHPEISGTLSLADFQKVTERPPADASGFQKIRYNRRSLEVESRVKESDEAGAAAFVAMAPEAADLVTSGDAVLNEAGDELWRITAQASILSTADYGEMTDNLNARVQSVLRYYPGASHVVTGTVPLFLRTQRAVLESLIRSFGLAFGIIAVVMIVLLRHPVSGIISMIPNLVPIFTVFGLMSWCGQRVDIGAMITASVALGIAVDGTLHLLTWFRTGIKRGLDREEAMTNALSHCGPAMWQTSVAVGVGLLMLYPAELLLISRFGWLMAGLVVAALVADVILLPALLVGPMGAIIEKTTRDRQEKRNPQPAHPVAAEAPSAPHFAKRRSTTGNARLPR